ncbi:hypothetical protein PUN28_010952 [Cardiocondyla obscurior]|uniref:Uncharacterized protein n=1 Tax=Cardiocondyla obscurior TaxID=286306 RepID=A0AAW2FL56_9HYME
MTIVLSLSHLNLYSFYNYRIFSNYLTVKSSFDQPPLCNRNANEKLMLNITQVNVCVHIISLLIIITGNEIN